MRKILAALLALFVLSTAVLAAGHTATTKKQTDIHITETTVRGDPSAAEGLELQITANYDRYLYWQTSYAAGAGPTCETDFRFYNSRQNRSRGMTETLDIQTASLNYGIGGNGIDLEEWENNQEVGRQTMMLKPAIDTASRTSASETRTELLNLRDYYDLFKVQIEVHLSGAIKRDDSWKSAIASYFRFPVPEDLQVSVTVTKDEAGNITDVNVEEVKGEDIYQAYASGVMLQDVFYFVNELEYNRLYSMRQDGSDLKLAVDQYCYDAKRVENQVFFLSDGDLWVYDISSGTHQVYIPGVLSYALDGKDLVYFRELDAAFDYEMRYRNLETGEDLVLESPMTGGDWKISNR